MGMFDKPKIGQELLDVPMGDMIQQMAFAIAEAQRRLDENAIDTAQMMGGLQSITDENTGEVTFKDSRVFFGKEKLTITDAIAQHNQTGDLSLRQLIREALTNSGVILTYPNLVDTALADETELETEASPMTISTVEYDLDDPSKIYKTADGNYYKYVSTTSPTARVYQDASILNANIASNGASATATIYIPSRVSMLELGFTPTFYQFVDTIIEVKISIKYTQDGVQTRNTASANSNSRGYNPGLLGLVFGGPKKSVVTTSHVNAGYSQKFSYSAEGSSLLRTKMVPIPPPAILEERIRLQMEILRNEAMPPLPVTA